MFDEIEILPGIPNPLGLNQEGTILNFSLYSSQSESVLLGFFVKDALEVKKTIPMNRTDNIWHVAIKNLPPNTLYAYKCGSNDWLLDPYAKILHSRALWNHPEPLPTILALAEMPPPFDWESIAKPKIKKENLIIYEMHVRGFTADSSSESKNKGTYQALIEKIPYFVELGVNAIELMPIFEFDESHMRHVQHPISNEPMPNYWGYNPLNFFSPKRSFSSNTSLKGPIQEFKTLVKELHRHSIAVILDVVYNHTGEGDETEYRISWRGIDDATYYIKDSEGKYADFTGCGNTFNANHPVCQNMILDSLRYWTQEMQVDGFRFDLCSILTRGTDGNPMPDPPILKAMKTDPILKSTLLISESWDAAGLYQIGVFPKWGPWSEWNGPFRDIVRRFLKGTDKNAGLFANVLCGSEFIYKYTKTPLSSVNFITAHDGYSLRDLVTYQMKHNEANGEENRDGANDNNNWNCGIEGKTEDPKILSLREKQMRNHFTSLFLSQGIPMLLMGDEYGHTRSGNNNPYVQDNEINWFLWNQLSQNQNIFHFVKDLIAFRKEHPIFHQTKFLSKDMIDWYKPDWSDQSRFVSFCTKGSPRFFVAFYANYLPKEFTLPKGSWKLICNTEDPWEKQYFQKKGPSLPHKITLAPYSCLIAIEG